MGVYIKGMEMPKESRLTLQISADGAVYVVNSCSITAETYTTDAVPVPPHGRLVDADRLLSEHMKQKYYHLPNGDIAIPIIDVEHAPAVIETEEVYGQYTDTAGNFHWCGTHSGEHKIKAEED